MITKEFCEKFAKEHSDIDITILSEPLNKKGKPAALNYGLKYVKHDICVFYDAGIVVKENTIAYLVEPLSSNKHQVAIGAIVVDNWDQNFLTKGTALDFTISAGGNLFFEVKNKIGSSAYLFGRNVLLNLEGIKVLFVPQAKAYDFVPTKWFAIKKQRSRWVGGYLGDMGELMKLKKGNKSGAAIIGSRNLSMLSLHHIDDWIYIVIVFIIIYALFGFYYLLIWSVSTFIFMFGYIINGIRKYADKHYSLLLWLPISAFLHLFMFYLQFALPKEISWEKTPLLLERSKEEIDNVSN